MAGHFALGNSNSLATIDVAGAFMVHLYPDMVYIICRKKCIFGVQLQYFLGLILIVYSLLGNLKSLDSTFWNFNVHYHLCIPNVIYP